MRTAKPNLSLQEALKTGRLAEFTRQAEANGVGPVSQADFDDAVRRVATQPRPEDRTSRSASRDGSTGK
jgi:hypothetical protein